MRKPPRPQPPGAAFNPAAHTTPNRQVSVRPAAPPAYRPQPTPKVLQRKAATARPQANGVAKKTPAAPAVYRPQPAPKVLQTKRAVPQQQTAAHLRPRPTAPPAPVSQGVQAKTAGPPRSNNHPAAPPVYRPQPVPKVLQTKMAPGQQASRREQERPPAATLARGAAQLLRPPAQTTGAPQPPVAQTAPQGRSPLGRGPGRVVQRHTGRAPNPFGLGGAVVQLKGKGKGKKAAQQTADEDEQPAEAKEGPGAQKNIQQKMVELCRLLLGQGRISQDVEQWFKDVIDNGLCGGWAAVHRAEPETLTKVWLALVNWDPSDGLGGIKTVSVDDIVAVLTHAYNAMNKLEPAAEYGVSPEEIESVGRALTSGRMTKVKSYVVTVGKRGGGQTVLDRILAEPKVKKSGNTCVVHIETQKHHMSLRTRSVASEVRIEEIVESEKSGVTVRPNRLEAYQILDDGIYMGLTDFRIDVNIYLLD
jgi:hypothetical protein